jgi:HAD superfamily hydrolase (TIGR01490 family)
MIAQDVRGGRMISPSQNSNLTTDPAIHPDRPVAAFFDVDNTLIPGLATELRFFRYLWRKGMIGSSEAARSLWFLLRRIPPLSVHPLRERKLYLEGKRPADIEPLAEEFVRTIVCPQLSQDGLVTLESHRRAGHHLILITGSLDFLIAPLACHLKVDRVMAAIPERRGDRYTGHLSSPYPYGDGKRHLIESFASEVGVDLKQSYAYGDSPGDVETLRSVGHPQVVNPIRGMGRIARREGWPITTWK